MLSGRSQRRSGAAIAAALVTPTVASTEASPALALTTTLVPSSSSGGATSVSATSALAPGAISIVGGAPSRVHRSSDSAKASGALIAAPPVLRTVRVMASF